jgi:hypothetical protein
MMLMLMLLMLLMLVGLAAALEVSCRCRGSRAASWRSVCRWQLHGLWSGLGP